MATLHLLIEGTKMIKSIQLSIFHSPKKAFSKTLFGTISCVIIWKIILLFCLRFSLFTNLECYKWLLVLKERRISSFLFVCFSSLFGILVTYYSAFVGIFFIARLLHLIFFLRENLTFRFVTFAIAALMTSVVSLYVLIILSQKPCLFSCLTFEGIVLCCLF